MDAYDSHTSMVLTDALGFNFIEVKKPAWHIKKQCLYFLHLVQTNGCTSNLFILSHLVRSMLKPPVEA